MVPGVCVPVHGPLGGEHLLGVHRHGLLHQVAGTEKILQLRELLTVNSRPGASEDKARLEIT